MAQTTSECIHCGMSLKFCPNCGGTLRLSELARVEYDKDEHITDLEACLKEILECDHIGELCDEPAFGSNASDKLSAALARARELVGK